MKVVMSVKFIKKEEIDRVDYLKILKPVRVVECGQTDAEVFLPGDVARVGGMDKLQLLYSDCAEVITREEAAKLIEEKEAAIEAKAKAEAAALATLSDRASAPLGDRKTGK